ncbi:MAG: hypothetical protein ACKORJ_09240, partial [Bacteroidota bacterium]
PGERGKLFLRLVCLMIGAGQLDWGILDVGRLDMGTVDVGTLDVGTLDLEIEDIKTMVAGFTSYYLYVDAG